MGVDRSEEETYKESRTYVYTYGKKKWNKKRDT